MRTKGYKCYNIKCGSCMGKTLCGEPEDAALSCVNRLVNVLSNGDRIRAMTDEEMAHFFCKTLKVECWRCPAKDLCYTDHNGFSEWLKQPAEDTP